MIYVASPFTHDDPSVMEYRYYEALAYTVELIRDGKCAFSPIVYSYDMFLQHNLPADYGFWKHHNDGMLRRATEVHILKMEGWKESKGLAYEIKLATSISIPITFIAWPV